MKFFFPALLVLLLFGCASTQTRIDSAQLAELQKGKTTVAEVISRFGRPTVLSKNMDGSQTAAYLQAEGRSEASGYVPLMAAIVSDTDASVASVTFNFDANGVLTNFRTTQPREVASAAPASPVPHPGDANPSPPAGSAASAAQTAAKPKAPQARSSSGDPWKIELNPSGYRENR